MARKRALMACSNYWSSPFQVGSHHLARGLVRAGYDVAFVSDPISPSHLGRGWRRDLRRRFGIYRSGGRFDLGGRLWTYVPGAFLIPQNVPILRSEWVLRNWQRWTWPNLFRLVDKHAFADVDLLYIDSLCQPFWLDAITYRCAVYRVADYNPQFSKYTRATRTLEHEIAKRVDMVLYPSQQLHGYAEALGARRSLLLPNGVDYQHYAGRTLPQPMEYARLPRPRAVYFGVMPEWFHFDWVRHAALRLPHFTFVLIGPDSLARKRLGDLPNVHLLGVRPYKSLPGYLQHADIGLMPFDLKINPRGVSVLQPQKLNAYLASGLPVVSADWENIRALQSPAVLCATPDQFVAGLEKAVSSPGDRESNRCYAARFDWSNQVNLLLDTLEGNKACAA